MSREMRHSGIEWIGEIPKEWKIMPFKQMYELGKGLSITKADLVEEGIPVISYGQIHSKANTGTTIKDELIRFVPDRFLDGNASSLVKKGDVIFADTSEDLDGCGNCVYIDRDITIFAGYHTIIAKNQSSTPNNYLSYLFKTDCWRSQIRSSVNGVKLFSVPQRLLGSTTIILPPFSEQQKIANYLDKVCGEVDEMIALQEQMIEKLKAYKQSVITEAVTKGLNPDVPMKDSGIDWIGEVPEGWEIVRLKALGGLQNGISQSGDYFGEDFEYPFISYSDVYKNIEIPYPSGRANSTIEDRIRYSVLEGDVLFTRTSETIEEIGFAATCTNTIYNAVFSGFLIRFRPNSNKLFKGYSKYYFRSDIHRAYFVKEMNLVTRASLSQDLLKNLFVLIPSFSEQQSIASYLDTKCAEIDALIAIKQAKIEELKDYKKSVIYEYVTGKKEVTQNRYYYEQVRCFHKL